MNPTIPPTVVAALAALQAAITLASPLANQSLLGLAPCINAALALVQALDSAIAGLAPSIDNISPSGGPVAIIAQVNAAYTAAQLQAQLVTMRGYAGRVLLNLQQATG